MPGIARQGVDIAGGLIIQGSTNVMINGSPAVRIGDAITGHGTGAHAAPVMALGSFTVFVNGIAVCRAGDLASCGHTASGSSDVIAG